VNDPPMDKPHREPNLPGEPDPGGYWELIVEPWLLRAGLLNWLNPLSSLTMFTPKTV